MPMTNTHSVSKTRCPQDVDGISELTILPDGRLYVLGLSKAVLEMLEQAGLWRDIRFAGVSSRLADSRITHEERQA